MSRPVQPPRWYCSALRAARTPLRSFAWSTALSVCFSEARFLFVGSRRTEKVDQSRRPEKGGSICGDNMTGTHS